jgi:hypothetical protein
LGAVSKCNSFRLFGASTRYDKLANPPARSLPVGIKHDRNAIALLYNQGDAFGFDICNSVNGACYGWALHDGRRQGNNDSTLFLSNVNKAFLPNGA